MKLIGVGCDIVSISRIQDSIEKFGKKFLTRIFTLQEIELAPSGPLEVAYYAKRFAAKEAIAKAYGTGIGKISFTDIEVRNNAIGKPFFSKLPVFDRAHASEKICAELSLSDDAGLAIAYVIVYQQ